jgi:DNA mismatch repair protein MutL
MLEARSELEVASVADPSLSSGMPPAEPAPLVSASGGREGSDAESRVRLLDPLTVNQIAAGEVVERPASVVKELIENALDAGAKRIEIDLVRSGRELIRVSDDGIGMTETDARAALERHATSKIRSADDLVGVRTLGFRGEALPSIASVSRMTISTARVDGRRHVLRLEGGIELAPEEGAASAGPRGTEIRVEDLFYNLPARLKFLKSDATELAACLDHAQRYALAYPGVAFRVTHNGQLALETSGSGDLLHAVHGVWGLEMARALAEVDCEAAGLKVRGFVSPPHLTRPTRAYQHVFVNGRPVRSRTFTVALDQAYRDLTPERRYPALLLMLEIDPAAVDVNVSPTKSEVRFQREGQAFDALRYAIRSALAEHGMMPNAEALAAVNGALAASAGATGFSGPGVGLAVGQGGGGLDALLAMMAQRPLDLASSPGFTGGSPGGGASAEMAGLGAPPALEPSFAAALVASGGTEEATPVNERFPFAELLRGLRVVGQMMNTFILAETERGLAIIDQHVAHERVLYEYLCGIKGSSAIERQALLTPETLHLDRRAAVLLRERLDEVEAVGFSLEPFGGESFLIRAAPAALRGKCPVRALRDLVDELVDCAVTRRLAPTREQIWITSACKMAVKAGDPLSHAEMEKLIYDLAQTENPYLCPHGRPITITLGRDELLRKFKRT